MSYFKEALGATGLCPSASPPACPSLYGKDKPLYQNVGGACINVYTGSLASASLCPSAGPSASSTPWYGKVFGGFMNVVGTRSAGSQPAAGGMPSWLLPVGVGVVAIGAVLLLTKKKKSPAPAATPAAAATSNPRRRR